MRAQIHRFPMSNRCNKNLVSIHQVNKQTLHHQSITQNGNSIRWIVNVCEENPDRKKKKRKKKLEFAIFDFSRYKTLVHSAFTYKRIKMFSSQNIPLHAFNPLRPGSYKRSYILKQTCS